VAVAVAPVLALVAVAFSPKPSVVLFAGRLAGALAAGLLTHRIAERGLDSADEVTPRRRWTLATAVVAATLYVVNRAAWWWPLWPR
jgi:hypothetical protein